MKYTTIFFLLLVLTGCNAEQDEEILMTEKFWNTISTNDVATLKGLISESEYNSAFGKESGFSGFALVADVKVGEKLKNGNVKTIFKKFCHPEYSTETVII